MYTTITYFSILLVIDNPDYEISTEHTCEPTKKHDDLGSAMRFCDSYDLNCKGIWDQFCDGRNIFTCGEISPADDPSSPSNGCTYINKCKVEVFIHDKLV